MRKTFKLLFLLVIFMFIALGCQSEASTEKEIEKISISKSAGLGKVNTDFIAVYEDTETIAIFKEALSKAAKQPGVVDIADPEYDFEVLYTDGSKEGYHLWVGESGQKGTLMNVNDTNTIYTLSEEITNQLRQSIK